MQFSKLHLIRWWNYEWKKTETIESKCILQLEWLQNCQLRIKYSCTLRAFCQTVKILNL